MAHAQIDKCFGFDTAVEEAQRALLAAKVEAGSARRGIGLVRLMGRQSGYIAMQASMASGAPLPPSTSDLWQSTAQLCNMGLFVLNVVHREHGLLDRLLALISLQVLQVVIAEIGCRGGGYLPHP